jgi:isopenicillin-N epimerase
LLFSLDPAVAHLNHGAFGAVPIPVQRAQQRVRDEMDANPVRFFTMGISERIAHVRQHLAGFLGADPDGSALVDNATTGTAIVLGSLDLHPGDEILMTDHRYNATRLAVREACAHTGAVIRTARVPLLAGDAEARAAIRAACSARTKLIIVDAVTSPTARTMPTRGLASGTDAAVLVDAAHAPGLLTTPVRDLDVDFWVGNLHKWGFAPRGTALLAVAPHWRDRIRPLVVSHDQDAGFPGNLEFLGIRDYSPWLAAPTGTYVLRTLGHADVLARNAALADHGQRVIASALGVKELPDLGAGAMRLIALPDGIASTFESARALRDQISDELATEVAVNSWQGRGLLRVSAQVYNRPEEYERLAERLPALLGR